MQLMLDTVGWKQEKKEIILLGKKSFNARYLTKKTGNRSVATAYIHQKVLKPISR